MHNPYVLLVETEDLEYARDLETVLNGAGIDLVVAFSSSQALSLTEAIAPAALMLDLDRPPRESVRLLGDFRSRGVDPPVLWISSSITEAGIKRVIASGAQGLLPRDADTVAVVCAVRSILSGHNYFPPVSNPSSTKRAAEESQRILALLKDYAV